MVETQGLASLLLAEGFPFLAVVLYLCGMKPSSLSVDTFFRFSPHAFGHGGEKRTAQMVELLEEAGIRREAIPFPIPSSVQRVRFLKDAVYREGLALAVKMMGCAALKNRRNDLRTTAAEYAYFYHYFKNSPSRVVLWDYTFSRYAILPYAARKAGKKVVAIPHNLESLVPEQPSYFSRRMSPHWLEEEVGYLRDCEAVVCISQEETWLLRTLGVRAHYLPYYPPKETRAYLEDIRRRRMAVSPSSEPYLLMLGTAGNPPTLRGMLDRIAAHQEKNSPILVIAGYLTEKMLLNESKGNPRIRLEGEVSKERLAALMVGARAMLIHQEPTSGALTRVTESLIAGVPVLCNFNASRSFYHKEGVYIYETSEQMNSYFKKMPYIVPVFSPAHGPDPLMELILGLYN